MTFFALLSIGAAFMAVGIYFLIGGLDGLLAEVESDERYEALSYKIPPALAPCDTGVRPDAGICACGFSSKSPTTSRVQADPDGDRAEAERIRLILKRKGADDESS